MTCIKCFKTILFVAFSLFVGTMSAMDRIQMFATVWGDHARIVEAQKCFQACCADDQQILKVTKHLIGHKHVMERSEIDKTIPTSWLLINEGEGSFLFKFLRELYTIGKVFDLLRSPIHGQVNSQNLLNFLKGKRALLESLAEIFGNGVNFSVTKDQSHAVLKIIDGIKTQLTQEIRLVEAKKYAEAFVRQLTNNPDSVKDVATRVRKEIQKYEDGGVNVDNLRAYVLNVDDLKPLIALVEGVTRVRLAQLNWNEVTDQIQVAVDRYFQPPLSQQIDESVLKLFVPTIRNYTYNFAKLDSAFETVEERVEKKEEQISAVALSFLRAFEPEEFKTFVVSVLGDSAVGLNVPKSAINVTAVLKSALSLRMGGVVQVHMEGTDFDVLDTFIATFFPNK